MGFNILLGIVFLISSACQKGSDSYDTTSDADGDGLSYTAEIELGTDPFNPDTDGDGLVDGIEVRVYGSDPLDVDTDDDTYQDNHEVIEGTSPTNRGDRIYTGYWPYNPDKDEIAETADWNSSFRVGELFPRFKAVDQFGDQVDLYDFANSDKKIVIDISAEWCGPCHIMSAWLDGDPEWRAYDEYFPGIREKVNNGEILWITILGENNYGRPADSDTVFDWFRRYSNSSIPILADSRLKVVNYISLQWWPSLFVLDENMMVLATPDDNINDVL